MIAALSSAPLLSRFQRRFDAWIDTVSDTIIEIAESLRTRKTIELVEDANETFAISGSFHAGTATAEGRDLGSLCTSQDLLGALLHIKLLPKRFIFREMEVPGTAREFVDGLVRSQLEKLMPWNPRSALYGWVKTDDLPDGGMKLCLAGCSLESIEPLVNAFSSSGAYRFSFIVADPKTNQPVQIWEQKGLTLRNGVALRHVLSVGLAAIGCATVLAIGIWIGFWSSSSGSFAMESEAVQRGRSSLLSPVSAEGLLHRKSKTPATVVLIDDLAKLLPDETFVTELRVEGEKFWITGTTDDAASLLVLMGHSKQFTGASFFAPTTRSGDEKHEVFHIEATTRPSAGSRS